MNGIAGALLVLFVALKLTSVIAWSWLWVLAPVWIPLVLVIGLFAFALIVSPRS